MSDPRADASATPRTTTASAAPRGRFAPVLAALAALLLVLVLAAVRPLALPDEGRYAEISRWMLVSGDWLVPRLNDLPFFHKPPLTHWLQAALMALLGPTPWAARLVPALAAIGTLAGLYGGTRAIVGEAVARRAALMLGTSLAFLVGGQYVNHDMLVAWWISAAIGCFALALLHGERPHTGLALAGFACCALGVLTKGLIGVALPGLVLALWVAWTRRWRQLPRLPWLRGVALAALIALPWFVLAGQRHPGVWAYLFGVHQFGRFTGATFNNQHGLWFYPVGLLVLLFPWAFFAPLAARNAAQVGAVSGDVAIKNKATDLHALAWIWLAAIVLFFSLPRSKLIGYVLPVVPPLALLAAWGWQRAMAGRRHAGRVFVLLALLPVGLALGATLYFRQAGEGRLSGPLAAFLSCAARPDEPLWVRGGYPYDLPFLLRRQAPLRVVADWPKVRATAGDSWEREMLDAADFDPARAAELLQAPAALDTPSGWLVQGGEGTRGGPPPPPPGWARVPTARSLGRWTVYRAPGAGTPDAATRCAAGAG